MYVYVLHFSIIPFYYGTACITMKLDTQKRQAILCDLTVILIPSLVEKFEVLDHARH